MLYSDMYINLKIYVIYITDIIVHIVCLLLSTMRLSVLIQQSD